MAEQNMKEFIDVLSSKAPVPGGGGACAYVAAAGMALGSMVANLTTGKKKYAEYQQEIDEILEKAAVISKELIEYMDKDAESFEPLSKAYGLPKETEEQAAYKEQVMEKALMEASLTPIALMEKIMEALRILDRLSVIGSRLAVSDVGAGVQLCRAALNGASLNVFINTKLMKNTEAAEELNVKTDELLIEGNELADRIYETVIDAIR
ncbi:MAG: cyclodeaminase/cyclohydrolase family protein [Lachnospira sp.]|nr:cyclodeaminase/cyclohydrolase family protein [Lachnospira sp.]